jgi:hypothetical protein
MNTQPVERRPSAREFWSWFGFWGQFVGLGLVAAIGGLFAGESTDSDDSACGLLLMVAAIVLAFIRLKDHFDGRAAGWSETLFVDTMPNLTLAIVLFAILGLLGLVTAAEAEHGALHNAGVALFVVAVFAVFLNMKRVFDTAEMRR